MLALIRLYPHSPIEVCNYDHRSRKLDYYDLYVVQPTMVIEDRSQYGITMLYSAYNEMLINSNIVFACPFNLSFNMFIRTTGEGFTLPLWQDSEVEMVKFYNPFPETVLMREKYYVYEMFRPTPYIHTQMETRPAYKIYFPESNMCFDGKTYWTPSSPPEELLVADEHDYYMQGVSSS